MLLEAGVSGGALERLETDFAFDALSGGVLFGRKRSVTDTLHIRTAARQEEPLVKRVENFGGG
jgi:hypothetical protein